MSSRTRVTPGGASGRARLDQHLVVDADIHPTDEPSEVARFCDRPWRRVLEERQAVPPYPSASRVHPIFPGQHALLPGTRPLTAREMREDLDALGIDLGLLFAQGFHTIGDQPDIAYARAVTQAHNRWQTETYLRGERGFYGAIGIAPQDPEFSAREIERYAGEERIAGVMMPCQNMMPPWGDRRFDPIFETAERHDLPLLYHGGPPVQLAVPFDLRQFDTPLTFHTYTHNVMMLVTVTSLLGSGVPVRYPRTRHLFIEAGLGWAAHLLLQLDRSWEDRRGDVPWLEEPPSAYMRRQMYYGTQPIEEPESMRDLNAIIELLGEENVLYASDWPHHDFDHPRKVFDIPTTPEGKRKIIGENALRVLRIPRERAYAECVPGKSLAHAATEGADGHRP